MTPEESKKLDDLCEKVAEIHNIFYKEPGIVHEVKDLTRWKKSVTTNLTWVARIIVGLILTSTAGAVIFYWSNSK